MKRWRYICLMIILMLIVASFRNIYKETAVFKPQTYMNYREGEYRAEIMARNKELDTLNLREFYGIGTIWGGRLIPDWATIYPITGEAKDVAYTVYLFDEIQYRMDGVDALYPLFVAGASEEVMKSWNQIIDKDIKKILDIYSFNPFPDGKNQPSPKASSILNITYEVKSADAEKFSVLYKAAFNSKYVAHPTELVYTTNIRLKDSKRIKLSDIVKLDEAFVKEFRQWKFTVPSGSNQEVEQAIRDYMNGLTDSELLEGLKTADQIGSGNYLGMYSYLTPGQLGISVSVPNYLGDHVEFEQDYDKLGEFLLPGTNMFTP